jgi:hypothetical protein
MRRRQWKYEVNQHGAYVSHAARSTPWTSSGATTTSSISGRAVQGVINAFKLHEELHLWMDAFDVPATLFLSCIVWPRDLENKQLETGDNVPSIESSGYVQTLSSLWNAHIDSSLYGTCRNIEQKKDTIVNVKRRIEIIHVL